MGLFKFIKSAFDKLFGEVEFAKYDNGSIINVIQAFPQTLDQNTQIQILQIKDDIDHVYKTANCKEFTIGIIGDFTVGKSSFVNALLGTHVTPVSANPSTAIITKIKYGNAPKAIIHYVNDKKVEMSYDEFVKFSAFNLDDFRERNEVGHIERLKDIEYATIYVQSNFLKNNNLCLVDTLGLSAHESDNKKTIDSIKDSIAIIYICAERGLSDKDVKFISDYLHPETGNFFFCVHRIDLIKKSERNAVVQLVDLKLKGILKNRDLEGDFLNSKIFLVSSLYQEFANGFTDNDSYSEKIDYSSCSGFKEIMSELCLYITKNAVCHRQQAIINQLNVSISKLQYLKENCCIIIKERISANEKEVHNLSEEIKRLENKIKVIDSSFEKLENSLYSLLPNFKTNLSILVNNGWNDIVKRKIDAISFGFRDYIDLETAILGLKLNVFKSMQDSSRYAQLNSLSPVVNFTRQHIQSQIGILFDDLRKKTQYEISEFISINSYRKIYENYVYDYKDGLNIHPIDFGQVSFGMYRASAQAAIESTFVKNSTRKIKMLNAAKDEAMKLIDAPLAITLKDFKKYIHNFIISFNNNATCNLREQVNEIISKISSLNKSTSNLKKELTTENIYFNTTMETIKKSLLSIEKLEY